MAAGEQIRESPGHLLEVDAANPKRKGLVAREHQRLEGRTLGPLNLDEAGDAGVFTQLAV